MEQLELPLEHTKNYAPLSRYPSNKDVAEYVAEYEWRHSLVPTELGIPEHRPGTSAGEGAVLAGSGDAQV